MEKQKSIKELLKPSSEAVEGFFYPVMIQDGTGKKIKGYLAPETFTKQAKASGFTIRGLIAGKINKLDKLISILNGCGYRLDEIKISKIKK